MTYNVPSFSEPRIIAQRPAPRFAPLSGYYFPTDFVVPRSSLAGQYVPATMAGEFTSGAVMVPPFRSGLSGVVDDLAAWITRNQTLILIGAAALIVGPMLLGKTRRRRKAAA